MSDYLDPVDYLPNISVDCVIFGFENGTLNTLILKMKGIDTWALPGGFVRKKESLDSAAQRVLRERTSLKDIFLRQYHVFGSLERDNSVMVRKLKEENFLSSEMLHFLNNRFLSVGYYALLKQQRADITADTLSDDVQWCDINKLPSLLLDHQSMVNRALSFLRTELNHQPVGLNLLPEKFTMTELQKLYEAILGRQMDRRNFSRKIQRFGILKKLNERRTGVAHKSPNLYTFDREPYQRALKEGFAQLW